MINQSPGAPYSTQSAPSALGVKPDARLSGAFLSHAFAWMFVGLLLTAGVSAFVAGNARLLEIATHYMLFIIIAQFAIVVGISAAINKISATAALGLFFVYAASVGLFIGVLASVYSTASVAQAFLGASAMFGGAAVYGAVTKRSLASMGGLLTMALFGLIAVMVINLFLHSQPLDWLIGIAGIGIFTVLTARDVQRIQAGDLAARLGSMEKAAVVGALTLYLDFLNLFLFFLRIMGGRS